MTLRTVSLVPLLALILTAGLLGCGDSSDDTAAGDTPADAHSNSDRPREPAKATSMTKAHYIARADGVCKKSWAFMLDSFSRRYRAVSAHVDNASYFNASYGKRFQSASRHIFLPSMQIRFDDIQYIGSPKGEKEMVETLIGSLQKAVYTGWERRIRSPKQFAQIFHRFNRLAYEYGINSCLVYEASFRQ